MQREEWWPPGASKQRYQTFFVKFLLSISDLKVTMLGSRLLVNHSHQVKKRLQQEQDDKDLLIILGDIPPLKVSCNFFQGVQESNSLWQEFEDLISATGEASLTGKAYLQGGRWLRMQLSKSLGDAQCTQPFLVPKCYIHLLVRLSIQHFQSRLCLDWRRSREEEIKFGNTEDQLGCKKIAATPA